MLYAVWRRMYLVDIDDHINLECENVIKLDIFFTIENLKRFADTDSATEHIWWLPPRSCMSQHNVTQQCAYTLWSIKTWWYTFCYRFCKLWLISIIFPQNYLKINSASYSIKCLTSPCLCKDAKMQNHQTTLLWKHRNSIRKSTKILTQYLMKSL